MKALATLATIALALAGVVITAVGAVYGLIWLLFEGLAL